MSNLPDDDEIYRCDQILQIDDTNWYVVLHWGEVNGRAEVVGLEMWSRPPFERLPDERESNAGLTRQLGAAGVPISSSILRQLNIGSLITQKRSDAIRTSRIVSRADEFSPKARQVAKETLEQFARPGRPAKYDERHFAEVARVYQAAYSQGHSPTRAVATHFGVSQAQAGKWVSVARNKYGLLGGTSKGRASGAARPSDGGHAASDEDAASDR